MGSLRDLNLKSVYRTGIDDLYQDFYTQSLSVSERYDRAVGYFSSEILAMNLKGLSRLIKSGGKMRLIIGHPLDVDEYEAIKHGEKLKELTNQLNSRLEEFLSSNIDSRKVERLELLAWMIASGKLEIKFAIRKLGMYHEKIGVLYDGEENIVVFQGSANETPHGLVASLNAESISVYKSWEADVFESYGREYIDGFENLWNNEQINTVTVDVASATYANICKMVSDSGFDFRDVTGIEDFIESQESRKTCGLPYIPKYLGKNKFDLFEHQKAALNAWKSNSFKGILKLATGSGKTITSIYGAVKIYEAKHKKQQQLFLVITVPYVELAIQWIDNLKIFGIVAHECFDSKSTWSQAFENEVNYFKAGASDFAVAVVVNRTLTSPYFQKLLSGIDENALMIIGDECHNHGSKSVNKSLPPAYYRMGLSATPFRSDEDEVDSPFPNDAKERILSYYGDIVATYGLDDAINDGVLTPYEYYIVPVSLTPEEQEGYEELSLKITKLILKQQGTGLNQQDRENLTRYCGQRSRLLGSAKNKLEKLKELTKDISEETKKHTLFYAGEGKPYGASAEEDIKVIDQVSKVLNKNGWKTSQFIGGVSRSERKFLMLAFKDQTIDALVAMKVLDEGIDVPACKTAYILASTKNPRQYVQRRGRILRKSANKHTSTIYDFVVLPTNDSSASRKLKLSEAERINDFAVLAINKLQIEQMIEEHGLGYEFT